MHSGHVMTNEPSVVLTESISPAIAQLVDELSSWNHAITLEEIKVLASRHRISREDLDQFVQFDDHEYSHQPIAVGPFFEIGCIGWQPGQSSPIHDHRGCVCWVQIVDGPLTNIDYREDSSGRLKIATSDRYQAGEWFLKSDQDVHQLINDNTDGQNAVSLHVYSPPLLPMKDRIRFDRAKTSRSD